jgi:hypothetical protein
MIKKATVLLVFHLQVFSTSFEKVYIQIENNLSFQWFDETSLFWKLKKESQYFCRKVFYPEYDTILKDGFKIIKKQRMTIRNEHSGTK